LVEKVADWKARIVGELDVAQRVRSVDER